MKNPRVIIRWLGLVVASCMLAVAGTWPLAAHLATRVYDPAREAGGLAGLLLSDVYLTLWILAWDARTLLTAPRSILDANIFHPASHTLALSEHMLGVLPVYLPIASTTRDPVLAHQATLVLSYALAFLTMAMLVRSWTSSTVGAGVAGALFAFSGFRTGNLAALHIEGNYYLPLVPLLAHRLTIDGRARWPLLLGLVLVLQGLSSYYLGYAAFAGTATLLLVVFLGDVDARRAWARLIAPVGGAVAIVAATSIPYARLASTGVINAPAPDLVRYSSAVPGHTGATAAVLVAVATVGFWRRGICSRVGNAWMVALLAAGLVTHVLALGPSISFGPVRMPTPFALMTEILPGFRNIRVPVRFNVVAAMCFSALAGFGVAGVLRRTRARIPRPAQIALVSVLALVVVVAVAVRFVSPLPTVPIETRSTLPLVYRWLADAPPGPLLEIPFEDITAQPLARVVEARRMYLSVYHWHPILNGYSGYVPRSYRLVSGLVRALPDRRALRLLVRCTGLRYVLVHTEELSPDQAARWPRHSRDFVSTQVFGSDVVYVAFPPDGTDLVERLVADRDTGRTILGTDVRALPVAERRATVDVPGAWRERAIAGIALDLPVIVTNTGSATWPVLSSASKGVAELAYRWQDASGRIVGEGRGPLPYDLAPSESVRTTVTVSPPGFDGPAWLVLGVAQNEEWFGYPTEPKKRIFSTPRAQRLTRAPAAFRPDLPAP